MEYIIRLLWYVNVRNKFRETKGTTQCIEWILRLAPFTELHSRTELTNITLNALLAVIDEKNDFLPELVGLYFGEIPYEMNAKLTRWKNGMTSVNPTLLTYITQAMKQSKPPFPWHYDPKFLQFTQQLLNMDLPPLMDKSNVIKDKWDTMITKYRAYYKLQSRLEYMEDGFQPYRGGEQAIPEELPCEEVEFYEELVDTRTEIEGVCQYENIEELSRQKPLRVLQSSRASSPPPPSFMREKQMTKYTRIGIDKLVNILRMIMKSNLTSINEFKRKDTKKSVHRRIYSMPVSLQFMASIGKAKESRPVQLNLTQLKDIKTNAMRHRRAASSAGLQLMNPFQIMRVPRKTFSKT